MQDSKMVLDVVPLGKPRMTQRDRWQKRPAVKRYYNYKDKLKELTAINGYKINEDIGTLRITFTLPMPPSWSKKKKLTLNGKPHRQRPDIDNLIKAFLDCLLKEDSMIHSVLANKVWGEKGSITVYPFPSDI